MLLFFIHWHILWRERIKINAFCNLLGHKVDLGRIKVESSWNLWLFMVPDQIFSGMHSPSLAVGFYFFSLIILMTRLNCHIWFAGFMFAVDWEVPVEDSNTEPSSKAQMAAESGSLPSPAEKTSRLNLSCFSLPRLFTTASNPSSDTEPVISPTSILDSKPFSRLKTSFWSDASTPRTPEPENKMLVVGSLGLVEVLQDDEPNDSKPSKMVLFGSQLRIQVPSLPPSVYPALDSPRSPSDFGIKTRNLQSPSPSLLKQSAFSPPNVTLNSPRPLSASEITEMELSEDYTCVISYGPNPKTVHIFGDCIVESCCGDDRFSPASLIENGFTGDNQFRSPPTPSESYLSFCYTCKKNLGPGSDTYMYRSVPVFSAMSCQRFPSHLITRCHNPAFWLFQGGDGILQQRMPVPGDAAGREAWKDQTSMNSHLFPMNPWTSSPYSTLLRTDHKTHARWSWLVNQSIFQDQNFCRHRSAALTYPIVLQTATLLLYNCWCQWRDRSHLLFLLHIMLVEQCMQTKLWSTQMLILTESNTKNNCYKPNTYRYSEWQNLWRAPIVRMDGTANLCPLFFSPVRPLPSPPSVFHWFWGKRVCLFPFITERRTFLIELHGI